MEPFLVPKVSMEPSTVYVPLPYQMEHELPNNVEQQHGSGAKSVQRFMFDGDIR
jgi:hypothetical protein